MEEEYGKKEQTAKTNASRKQVCDRFWSGVSLDVCGRGLRGLPRFIIPLSSARSEPSPCLLQASKKRHAVSSNAGSCSVPNRQCPRSLFRRQKTFRTFWLSSLVIAIASAKGIAVCSIVFASLHSTNCNICINEARLAGQLRRQGKTPGEIRTAIIQKQWTNLGSSK